MGKSRVAILGGSVRAFELADALRCLGVGVVAMVPPRQGLSVGVSRRASAAGITVTDVAVSINDPDTVARLVDLRCDLFVNWGHEERFGSQVLSAAALGALNLHPGRIPGARGREPVFGAMLEDWPAITQTVHRMGERFDDGPVIATREIAIDDQPYRDVVELRLQEGVVPFYRDAIAAVLAGDSGRPGEGASRYFPGLTPRDDTIDWRCGRAAIGRRVRALSPFKPCRTWSEAGDAFLIWRAEPIAVEHGARAGQVVASSPDFVEVATADGLVRCTEIEEVEGAGSAWRRLRVGTLLLGRLP